MTSLRPLYDVTYKILVIGDSNVGKTSLIYRYTAAQYGGTYISTIGIDSHTKIIEVDGEIIRLQIWDTAGLERFRTLTAAYYRGATGIMLVYDVTEICSFSNISNWMETIEQNASPGVCQLLVANKIDSPKDCWDVMSEKGAERASASKLQFFEASAKEGVGVEEAFVALAKMIKTERRKREEHLRDPSVIVQSTIDLSPTKSSSSSACC